MFISKNVPIANIDVRQKGVGYAGLPSFNMKVHDGFAKYLKDAQVAVRQESFYYLKGYTDMEYLIEMAKQV